MSDTVLRKTMTVNGYMVDRVLVQRKSGAHSVWVWRNAEGEWCWAVIGWSEVPGLGSFAFTRITGHGASQFDAITRGLLALEIFGGEVKHAARLAEVSDRGRAS